MKKKIRFKPFLRIFFILAAIQFIVVLADMFLHRAHNELSAITSIVIRIFSLPINLIHPSLPFYTAEGLHMGIALWILNLTIQTMVIYGLIVIFKRLKERV